LRISWAGWRLALRLGRREAWRAKGRSALVLVMITLPVIAVVTTAVLASTINVNAAEGVDRQLGTKAAALVTAQPGIKDLVQGVDPGSGGWSAAKNRPRATQAQIRKTIGDRPMLRVDLDTYLPVRTEAGLSDGMLAAELDPTDPLAAGLFSLEDGHWPHAKNEVVVNSHLAGRGPGLGEMLTVPSLKDGAPATQLRVVGIAESAAVKNKPAALALPGSFPAVEDDQSATWLVGGGPVTWDDVRALNKLGVTALSRAVVLDPPAAALAQEGGSSDNTAAVVGALVAVMALIEVVLLAGPAFAVGARRQSRTLALMAASGSTPRQARRVVLGLAVVLGTVAGLVGLVGGIGLARAIEPIAQHYNGDWLGPFDVPWPAAVGVAAFGVVSALLAAVVPAWIASRQDVVAVLSGRRGEGKPSLRSPLLGLVLLGLGIVGAVLSTRRATNGEVFIAGSAILCVLGMVFLVPVVVALVGRLAGRLPLPLRFATRDAARHRSRTAPAVAAVAATVAGVVALGIGNASDQKENRETYTATLPMGQGLVTAQVDGVTDWTAVRGAVAKYAPKVTTTPIVGIPEQYDGAYLDLSVRADGEDQSPESYGGYGASAIVSAGAVLPSLVTGNSELAKAVDADKAAAVLRDGGAVVFTSRRPVADRATLRLEIESDTGGASTRRAKVSVPALFVHVDGRVTAPAAAVVSATAAHRLGVTPRTTALLLDGGVSKAAEENLHEALLALGTDVDAPSVYVERGYQPDSYAWLIQIVLGCLGAVLMLGGTLTATFLALSDARPDLATLSAVGAAARTRRGIAAAYAVVVALVGAVLGALVGLVPGIAVTYPLTRTAESICDDRGCVTSSQTGPFLEIPWLLIVAVVIGLPLLVAGVVAATTRSRLPLVARLD